MKLLLDTHALLWWANGDRRLSKKAGRLIADAGNELLLSAAVVWEVAIKAALGRLQLGDTPAQFAARLIGSFGMVALPIRMEHALGVYDLPPHHQDPFDRLLVAQAQIENVAIITHDAHIRRYGVGIQW